MNIPVSLHLDIVQGDDGTSLWAVPHILLADGTIGDTLDKVQLVAGQTLTYGPVSIKCDSEAAFSSTPTEAATLATKAKANVVPPVQSARPSRPASK
jgi:hypothetical protein